MLEPEFVKQVSWKMNINIRFAKFKKAASLRQLFLFKIWKIHFYYINLLYNYAISGKKSFEVGGKNSFSEVSINAFLVELKLY